MMSLFNLLYFVLKYASAIAIPTAVANPCPSGPVVQSTPGVFPYSGCPGVIESIFLKFFKSSNVISNPAIYNVAYKSADPCPADITNLSLLKYSGSSLSKFK